MSGKLSKIILLSLGISIILYSISKIDFSSNLRSIHEYKSNTCKNKKIDKKFLEKYSKENSTYTYIPKSKMNLNISFLFKKNLINNSKNDFFTYQIISNLFSLNSDLIGLSVIIAMFTSCGFYYYCSCFCCNCFLCNKKIKGDKCPYIYLILSIILYLIVIILSILSTSVSLEKGIFSSFCSIEKFYENIINGDDNKNITPRWVGIEKFSNNVLKNISKPLESTVSYQKNISDYNKLIKKEKEEIVDTFYKLKSYISNQKIQDPKKKNDKIIPSFNNLLMKDLISIEKEISSYLYPPIEVIDFLDKGIYELSDFYSSFDQSLNEIIKKINATSKEFNELISSFTQNISNDFDKINGKNILDSKNYIYIIIFVVTILTIIFSLLTISYYNMKYFSFVGWSCLSSLIGPLIFLGIFFIILANLFSGVYIFFNEVVNIINNDFIKDKSSQDYISVCYKGNGSISSFKNDISKYTKETKIVDDIYGKNKEIINQTNNLNKFTFETIEKSKKEITLDNMFSQSTELNPALNELNKYINYGDKEKYISENSKIKPYEIFVMSSNNCLEGYKYTKFEDKKESSEKDKLCFVITEWDKDKFNSRYYKKEISLTNSKVFNDTIDNYQNSLFSYINDFKDYINSYRNNITELKKKSDKLLSDIIASLKVSKDAITPIINFFKPVTNGLGIFSSLNCNFLHKNINLFFEALDKELGLELRNLGNYSIYIGLFLSISSWFIIIAISRIALTDEEKRMKEIENNMSYKIMKPFDLNNGETELKTKSIN